VFLLPGALDNPKLPQAFADSLTMGSGQFCTNPGLLIGLKSDKLQAFVAPCRHHRRQAGHHHADPGHPQSLHQRREALAGIAGVSLKAAGQGTDAPCGAQAFLYQVPASAS
jgi:NADP-dependent aldehyde dehydrogenase